MAYTLIDEKKVCRIYQDTEKALDKTLAHIVQLLDGEHQTIATAESCTRSEEHTSELQSH